MIWSARSHTANTANSRGDRDAQHRIARRISARNSAMRRADKRSKRAGENDALETDVDDARAFDDDFTQRRERERRRGADRRFEKRRRRELTPMPSRDRERIRARSSATSARMMPASNHRLRRPTARPRRAAWPSAPASSAPKRIPVPMTPSAIQARQAAPQRSPCSRSPARCSRRARTSRRQPRSRPPVPLMRRSPRTRASSTRSTSICPAERAAIRIGARPAQTETPPR